ncbi:hypothetical protein M8818_007163 [Zalaria obscura]|uniref:Uncharacterized protein n=1 Tax=Zalaria obscura TaxID=2024903 RepID=A0ACC3S536_9PEZI
MTDCSWARQSMLQFCPNSDGKGGMAQEGDGTGGMLPMNAALSCQLIIPDFIAAWRRSSQSTTVSSHITTSYMFVPNRHMSKVLGMVRRLGREELFWAPLYA